MKTGRLKRKILKIIILLVFVTGLAIFLYPYTTKWFHEQSAKKVVDEFYEEAGISQDANTGSNGEVGENVKDTDKDRDYSRSHMMNKLYEDLQAYNKQIYEEGQKELKDPFSYKTSSFDLTQYGLSENVIGILWIPRLELELPIYMGANYDNLAKGIGLLGNTSMPLGGENTNVVLAGHRGFRGIPMFRNIQSIQIGDKIQITTPWDTLVYRVTELKIVPKDSTDVIYIEEGKDRVTLLTCHPYTKNEQRYVVIAERSDEPQTTKKNDMEEAEYTESTAPQQVQVITGDGSVIEAISSQALTPVWGEGTEETGGEYSNLQIWLETWAPVIGIVIVLMAIIVFCIAIKVLKKKIVEGKVK